ncbi:MAG: FHA domain-containing protein [Acidobacteriota bacterium]|nr:FHA domain-containing protein [Acidobacteriota bacterium]
MTFLIHRLVGERTLLRTVEGDSLTIGRGAAADVRLDDAAVALEHAEIRREGKHWVLVDRGSVTGTYRNGRQVERETLSGDDTVEIGGYRLRFQVTHPEDPLFVHFSPIESAVEAAAPAEPREKATDEALDTATFEVPVNPTDGSAAPEELAPAGHERPSAPTPSPRVPDQPAPTQPAPVKPAPVKPALAPAPPEAVDYAAAYSLARPGWTKGALTVALTVVALITVAALAAGSHRPLMPGISSAHALIVAEDTAPAAAPGENAAGGAFLNSEARRIATRGCAACHRPWRGPAAVEDGCVACHGDQGEPHAAALASSPSAAAAPACASCHPEHRGQDLVRRAVAADCTPCHRELSAVVPNATVTPQVTSFASDHPELVVTLPASRSDSGGEEGPRRLSVAEAAGADPGTVDFGHRVHRVQQEATGASPAQTLRGPDGPVALVCGDCHVADDDTGRMQPVSFENHCQSCHRLSFDERLPDRQAPHSTPREVVDSLLGLYSGSEWGPDAAVSLRDRRLEVITGGGRQKLPPGVDRQVADAARTLFRAGCDFCHRVDLDAVPLPTVAPAAIPERWMPGARFSHLGHRNVACSTCHPDAATSEASADVLMPGIAACRGCHGAGSSPTASLAEDRGPAAWGGALACAQCHGYHRTEFSRPAPPVTAAGPSPWRRPG